MGAVLCTACSKGEPSSAGAQPTPPPAGRAPLAPTNPKLLLTWQATDKPDSARTTLWRANGNGYQRIADRKGVALFANDQLWHLTLADAPHAEVDCTCAPLAGFESPVPERCILPTTTKLPVLVAANGKRRWPMGEPPGKADTKDLNGTADTSFTPRASLGALLIGARCTFRVACGAAHGSHGCEQVTFDVATGRRVPLFNAAEQRTLRTKLLPRAHARFRGNDDFFDGKEAVEFARLDFTVSKGGRLAAATVFTGDTSYVNSSDWGAYKMVQRVAMPVLPERLKPFADAPQPVRDAGLGLDARFGWSTLETTPEGASAIAAAFSSGLRQLRDQP